MWTAACRWTSAIAASGERASPVMANTCPPRARTRRVTSTISVVRPLWLRQIKTSSRAIVPRSPCTCVRVDAKMQCSNTVSGSHPCCGVHWTCLNQGLSFPRPPTHPFVPRDVRRADGDGAEGRRQPRRHQAALPDARRIDVRFAPGAVHVRLGDQRHGPPELSLLLLQQQPRRQRPEGLGVVLDRLHVRLHDRRHHRRRPPAAVTGVLGLRQADVERLGRLDKGPDRRACQLHHSPRALAGEGQCTCACTFDDHIVGSVHERGPRQQATSLSVCALSQTLTAGHGDGPCTSTQAAPAAAATIPTRSSPAASRGKPLACSAAITPPKAASPAPVVSTCATPANAGTKTGATASPSSPPRARPSPFPPSVITQSRAFSAFANCCAFSSSDSANLAPGATSDSTSAAASAVSLATVADCRHCRSSVRVPVCVAFSTKVGLIDSWCKLIVVMACPLPVPCICTCICICMHHFFLTKLGRPQRDFGRHVDVDQGGLPRLLRGLQQVQHTGQGQLRNFGRDHGCLLGASAGAGGEVKSYLFLCSSWFRRAIFQPSGNPIYLGPEHRAEFAPHPGRREGGGRGRGHQDGALGALGAREDVGHGGGIVLRYAALGVGSGSWSETGC